MRGEHSARRYLRVSAMGSSPHARGALCERRRSCRHDGIIPACAGSTIPPWRCYLRRRDHPRMRGEHDLVSPVSFFHVGSSPHARGAPASIRFGSMPDGIIPACAGSTSDHQAPRSLSRDHPRMRGEHKVSHKSHVRAVGSSPHARGAPPRGEACNALCRIIPACAGSTKL